ncbi:MAG: hypothetical protein M5U08_24315 [Burkholderiales bacterium]|nr:hypothetical protein [Burkholderiales bacterium]
MPILGIGFHSFVDGIVHSIAFTVSIFTGMLAAGVLVAVAIVLSEQPGRRVRGRTLTGIKTGSRARTNLRTGRRPRIGDSCIPAVEKR